MTQEVTLKVDEYGYAYGFSAETEHGAGAYGIYLRMGDRVELRTGGMGTIVKVYSHIQIGLPGTANYVDVCIRLDVPKGWDIIEPQGHYG